MGLRERKKDQTRRQILEAALVLIGRQGFEDTTINQIAAAVDISPRTVLRYFPTKEDVIVSWVEDGMAIFLSCLHKRPTDEPAHLSLLACARELLKLYQERADFYLTIERVIASSSGISARKHEMSAALGEKVSQVLSGRAAFSETTSLAVELYPAVIFSILRVVIRSWVATDGQRQLLKLFDEAVELINFKL
ncbi:transcriptional regulator, TetR family [Dickeya parazeae Ech586]|uniref:Transcriptional regulator, TetR family n=1 Tax=Dickeya zeae (strain Ech586) TaxID=590409 RepID=D2BSS5_DICZ5|nr:TetR/AcrR family transcriptional regulator [Dickeya parazeae]ACZ77688.1 transcriptional regulator, TetR family [Dickeya parazeae Ech586]